MKTAAAKSCQVNAGASRLMNSPTKMPSHAPESAPESAALFQERFFVTISTLVRLLPTIASFATGKSAFARRSTTACASW